MNRLPAQYIEAPALPFKLSRSTLPPFDSLVYSSMGFIILLIGSWVPDDRLNVAGFPIDIMIMIAAALVATTGCIRLATLRSIATLQLPFLVLALTALWSAEADLCLEKITTLFFSGNIAFILFNTVIEKYDANALAKLLTAYFLILLLLAIPYKLAFGFFDRQVTFMINGAIVFGRLMCIATLLSAFCLSGKKRIFAVILFGLAAVWTESKGPILAVLITLVIMVTIYGTPQTRRKAFWFMGIAVVGIILSVSFYSIESSDFGRVGTLYLIFSGDLSVLESQANQGSLGGRLEMWSKSMALITEKPFGVGLGGWDSAVQTELPTTYPHNLFLELWSEAGVIIGSFAAIPFLAFLLGRRQQFWFVSLCLFIAQMVSGDIGDARFLFVFGLLAAFSITPSDGPQHSARPTVR